MNYHNEYGMDKINTNDTHNNPVNYQTVFDADQARPQLLNIINLHRATATMPLPPANDWYTTRVLLLIIIM